MISRKTSSADVARKAGVSRTTVSFVLNNTPGKTISEATRRRVLEAAQELNYTPNERARTIAMVKHSSIGFFIPHSSYLTSDAYIVRVIEGMTPVLNKNRFQLVLQPLKLQEMNYLQLARQDNVDGIILMNTHDDDEGLAQVIDEGFPLVVIGSITNRAAYQIDIDNRSSAEVAVNYLIDLGHRDIAMLIHAPLSYYAARHRYNGYRRALEGAGLRPREEWVRIANLTEASGYREMSALLDLEERPTAVFAGNDVIAYGAIQAVRDRGLHIPEDLSIVGFDDDLLSRYLNPPLTTVMNPATGLGAEAAALLIRILKGRGPAEHAKIVPTSLAVRDSCLAEKMQEVQRR